MCRELNQEGMLVQRQSAEHTGKLVTSTGGLQFPGA